MSQDLCVRVVVANDEQKRLAQILFFVRWRGRTKSSNNVRAQAGYGCASPFWRVLLVQKLDECDRSFIGFLLQLVEFYQKNVS